MKSWLLGLLMLAVVLPDSADAAPRPQTEVVKKRKRTLKTKRKKKKKKNRAPASKRRTRRRKARSVRRPRVAVREGAVPVLSAEAVEAMFSPPSRRPAPKPTHEVKRGSKVTPGTASRWSNRGALEPVEGGVAITAPLPERNRPRPVGVTTPGQARRSDVDLLSARFSFSGYRLSTVGQDLLYEDAKDADGNLVRRDGDRDIELLRGRATLGYDRIAGSDFSVRVDVEVRPRLNGEGRFDNQRLNELYVAWGLTDVWRRGGPQFGVALGRVAIREAGQAQADGLAVRWRPIPELELGGFGGVTGNPYGYNWALRAPETFSADWLTGGLFARWRGRALQVSLAGVLTLANVPRPPPDPGSTDRIYIHGDIGWQPRSDVSVIATGMFDLLPNGQLIQNAEVAATWTPGLFDLTLAAGRFSTVTYEVSTGYSFTVDPARNTYDPIGLNNTPIVDEQGRAVVPFDGAQLTAVYNQVRVSAGYQLLQSLELYLRANALLRDVSVARAQTEAALAGEVPLAPTVEFAPLRLLPALGARFRDPKSLDADAQATWVFDEQSQADAIFRAGVGRGIFGLYARADARLLLGDILALDGGLSLIYSLPRDWFPGLLQLRGAFRYFREDVALERPASDAQSGALGADDVRALIPAQESFLGFAGIEWRL